MDLRNEVKTHSPLFYAHWEVDSGARIALPAEFSERAVYVAAGEVSAGGQAFGAGKMLVFDRNEDTTLEATAPRHADGAGRRARGRTLHRVELRILVAGNASNRRSPTGAPDAFKLPDFDNQEFIPLT